MTENSFTRAITIFQVHHGILQTQQAIRLGIAPRTLYQLRDSGIVSCESRGLYRLADMEISAHHDLVQVALRIPKAVICLISALSFHELTTQIPHQVYVALPMDAEKPRLEYPPIRLFWLSPKTYSAGIEEHRIEEFQLRIYSVEKTIADCLKFRNKVGLDVALEGLREYRKRPGFDIETLLKYARINHVERVIKPYLEMLG
jgi:predicted transcriptional regulator of viral defense system